MPYAFPSLTRGVTADTDGNKQELQTPYNLRGVAEASWSVSRITLQIVD
jgi:hypothetical protein